MTNTLDLGSWCILTTSSADTLRLHKSLTDAGLEVWTPIEKRMGRMPRTRKPYDKDAALMPSYLFGRVEHVNELLRLALRPSREHPRFTVFKHRGGIPLIADDQLAGLRDEETRKVRVFERWRRKGARGPRLARGTAVTMPDGPFAGIPAIVEDVQGQFTLVSATILGKAVEIKVASLLLAENMASDGLPRQIAA